MNKYTEENIIIPDELKRIINNLQENSSLREEVEKKLHAIIKSWHEIKEYIQYKKSNSILNGGLEVRTNSINEILSALDMINQPIDMSPAVLELNRMEKSEQIRFNTQYIASPSTASQRANKLAKRMDEVGSTKKYPDFSVEEDNMVVKVLHPQDKRAILIGYDTHCCFRPNGVADNKAKNEYSLLQYCTTTPYGGILKCESTDENKIYMGTPFLVNGNCMMFHSYETANEEKSEEVNSILEKAAIKAIEKSNGTIDVVFMTTLHKGPGRLNTDNRVVIPSFFECYTQDEYDAYSDMYSNLDEDNCILAARVGNEILTKEELTKWYKEECQENPENLINTLNLHMEARDYEYNFGKKEISEEIDIEEFELVKAFAEKKKEIEEERNIIALIMQKKKLEEKEVLSEEEKEEIDIIKSELDKCEKKEFITEINSKTIFKVMEELNKNEEMQRVVYSASDVDLIADIKGINIEEELRKKYEKKVENANFKNNANEKKGKEISILIAKLKGCNDENVNSISNLREKIARNTISDDELNILENAGLDVEPYKKAFRGESTISETKEVNTKAILGQKLKKAMNDQFEKERILADILFKDISDEKKRREKFMELKAKITIGIEKLKKMNMIMDEIDEEKSNEELYAKFIYGNSWYIALNEEGVVQETNINRNKDPEGHEVEIYEKKLEMQEIENISKKQVGEVTEEVKAEDKRKLIYKLKETQEAYRNERE